MKSGAFGSIGRRLRRVDSEPKTGIALLATEAETTMSPVNIAAEAESRPGRPCLSINIAFIVLSVHLPYRLRRR